MYRYKVDKAVTYTPTDFLLFRESPFAVWMERLTLENPDHGIPPDVGTQTPSDDALPQDEMVDTLREEGRDVVLIPWQQSEDRRRADTLDAMRSGADFVVNGMLALGPLSGNVNLLMRTSGYSDFGDFLYIPCDTQVKNTFNAAFRLCFMADLLHSLQGQLPPQMLLVRGDADVVPLQTEDHIYYYRAVKQRFMNAMRDFRKHRMPDPSTSSHFGRWSECASEVLRQRAMSSDAQRDEELLDTFHDVEAGESVEEAPDVLPMAQAGTAASLNVSTASAVGQVMGPAGSAVLSMGATARTRSLQLAVRAPEGASTLVEQARLVTPGTFRADAGPGQTPNLARFPRLVPDPVPQTADADKSERADKDGTLADIAQSTPRATPTITADGQPVSVLVEADSGDGVSAPERSSAASVDDASVRGVNVSSESASTVSNPTLTEAAPDAQQARAANLEFRDDDLAGYAVAASEPPLRARSSNQQGSAFPEDPLKDLAFIGSTAPGPLYDAPELSRSPSRADAYPARAPLEREPMEQEPIGGEPTATSLEDLPEIAVEAAPAPTLRESIPEPKIEGYEVEMIDPESLELEPREPHLLPPDARPTLRSGQSTASQPSRSSMPAHASGRKDSSKVDYDDALVDLDSAPPPTLMPVNSRVLPSQLEPDFEGELHDLHKRDGSRNGEREGSREDSAPLRGRPELSSSLMTSEDFDD